MDVKACRKPATSGQAATRTKAPALDVGGERTRDLQKGRQCRVAVDFDDELPGSSHGRAGIDSTAAQN